MKAFFLNYIFIIIIGIASVYTATYKQLIGAGKNPWDDLIKLIIVIIFLTIVYIIVISQRKIFYKLINNNIKFFYMIFFVLLILVLTSLGTAVGGAKSSINILIFNFQPIEYFKVITILYLAKIFSEELPGTTDKEFSKQLIIPLVSLLLIGLEPDYGGVVIMSALIFLMLFANNKHTKVVIRIFIIGLILAAVGFLVLNFLDSDRIGSWLKPFEYQSEAGGNLIQSYIAISNGGVGGVGYLNSVQNTGYLFASDTDFIFSVIAEEFGIIGVTIVLLSIFTFAYQIYSIGLKSKKKYEYLVCTGFSFLILIQTAINVGGVTGIIPMTGVTLPFISRGINSYLAMSMGVLYVVLIRLKSIEEERKQRREKRNEK